MSRHKRNEDQLKNDADDLKSDLEKNVRDKRDLKSDLESEERKKEDLSKKIKCLNQLVLSVSQSSLPVADVKRCIQ